ncbi:MAG: response regulator [Anaerolineales bacterium]|nr:response regulator [Anaerolineales bacterium]
MTRVLIIDDEPINHQLVAHALEPLKFELHFSANGRDGVAQARTLKPDVIITDVMMPDINGYEVTRILRREPQFSSTPILVLTAQSGLQDKIKSFEAGADDHLTKPFDAAELAVRVTSLLRRVEAAKGSQQREAAKESARMIAIHSLRGGTGCSSLAVNLGVGLIGVWKKPTILLDLTMTAGQVALMLNMTLRRTWADIARFESGEVDADAIGSILSVHDSGLTIIPAPTFPAEAEEMRGEALGAAIQQLKGQYEYIVADLPHDFSAPAIQGLDAADMILMVASPDMASIRAVTAALDTYEKLGYPKEKIKFVLNAIFPHSNLSKEKIEAALGMSAIVTIPYVQDAFVDAINMGYPLVFQKPELPVSGVLEDFAFHISKDAHKKTKPENPTDAWTRVYKRYQERAKRK